MMKTKIKALAIVAIVFLMAGIFVPETKDEGSISASNKTVEKKETKTNKKEKSEAKKEEIKPIEEEYEPLSIDEIPAYTSSPTIELNDNVPEFEVYQVKEATTSYEYYADLDSLGRATLAMASISDDLMPTQERESISSVTPTGWDNENYSCISGGWLYNRSHLIGFQLTGENANDENLITGTRYMNVEGMLPYENQIADFVKTTDQHVLYRVTPIYQGNNLVASGVQLEAKSVEDNGQGLSFNVYCYNVQPGVNINYATRDNSGTAACPLSSEASQSTQSAPSNTTQQAQPIQQAPVGQMVWIASSGNGTKYHSNPSCSNMNDPIQLTLQEAQSQGYGPCKKCY